MSSACVSYRRNREERGQISPELLLGFLKKLTNLRAVLHIVPSTPVTSQRDWVEAGTEGSLSQECEMDGKERGWHQILREIIPRRYG